MDRNLTPPSTEILRGYSVVRVSMDDHHGPDRASRGRCLGCRRGVARVVVAGTRREGRRRGRHGADADTDHPGPDPAVGRRVSRRRGSQARPRPWGLDLERDIITRNRLLKKKGASVELLGPPGRRGRGRVDPDSDVFHQWIDATHTAMLLYDEEGSRATEMFLKRSRLLEEPPSSPCSVPSSTRFLG